MKVENLAAENLWQLQRIGEDFTKLARYEGGFDINIFTSNWRAAIAANIGQIFVIRNESTREIEGCLGCAFIADTFNGRMTAMEQFWFVHPEARGRAAFYLLDAFEAEAKKRNCKKILMVHLEIEGSEILEKFYHRRGFVQVERTYSKEI